MDSLQCVHDLFCRIQTKTVKTAGDAATDRFSCVSISAFCSCDPRFNMKESVIRRMDRTDSFRKEILDYKRKSGISIETEDIIRPKVTINASLAKATDIVLIPSHHSFPSIRASRCFIATSNLFLRRERPCILPTERSLLENLTRREMKKANMQNSSE